MDELEGSSLAQSKNEDSDNGGRHGTDSAGDSDSDSDPWIPWFCSRLGNEFFCQVDVDYIKDDFNRFNLSPQVPHYRDALSMILDEKPGGVAITDERVKKAAKKLYGLIHARYILTKEGLDAMLEKFKHFEFERCPRYCCYGQACLPVGLSDLPGKNTVKIYCPQCKDIYSPASPQDKYRARVDGAYFGTTFAHVFLMTYEELNPKKEPQRYIPRIFGYKVEVVTIYRQTMIY
ncbi:PREDICTED: putative casein kinase II subunit beta-4 isoform X2 [Tarenaya hassleriana]|uniref:putative casein kinase II subunit beta-4 isoform X2 n=1 Tax=Tarenaya hassleriana TaxID=28532 RepID=UPI00053CA054|nr:PREDICTED: putative casein kinase II subunit beta-4 isoform X2 [Tarenaya hassleriana]